MPKFTIKRKYSLQSLGDEWKDCYIDLNALTIRELNSDLSQLADLNTQNRKEVSQATGKVLEIIKSHFISGTGVVDGKVVEITKDDLEDLPAEVLGGILSFLSQGTQPATGQHSAT